MKIISPHNHSPGSPPVRGSIFANTRQSLLAGLFLTVVGMGQALGATLTVCPSGCNYTSVKAAVTAAASGDTIQIGTGTYVETGQITINKNLTVTGSGQAQTTIQPVAGTDITAGGTGWWEIASGVTLNLSNLTLDGRASQAIPTPANGARLRTALYFGGNGLVDGVRVTNVGYTSPLGPNTLYLGWGIMQNYQTTSSMALTVRNSVFDNFGGTAIQTDAGNENVNPDNTPVFPSTVVVENNVLTCRGTPSGTNVWLQSGVTATGGADVTISGNTITDCYGVVDCADSPSYCGDAAAITAVSTFAKGTRVTATNNLLDGSYTGLYLSLYDQDRGPWTFSKNSLATNDLDVYYYRTLTMATPVAAANNWWGQNVDPVTNDVLLAGGGSDAITTTPWIATFVDDPGKTGQPGFWPLDVTNWSVASGTVNNGTLSPALNYVADGAKASFIATPAAGYYIAGNTFTSTGNCNGGGLTGSTWTTGAINDNSCVVNADFKLQVPAVDGVCGTDHNQILPSTPTNLCAAGIPSEVNGSGPWNWTCAGTVGTDRTGDTAYCSANLASYTVTGQVGAGSGTGTITPTSRSVARNGATSFTLTPAAGSVINNVSGCSGTLNGNLYTTGPITAACTVTATFAATNTTTGITSVSPSPSAVGQLVTVTFTVTNPGAAGDVVTVTDNAGNSCTGTVGTGNCVITFGTPGARTLIANYAPSGSAQASSSPGVNHLVADQPVLVTPSVPDGVVGALYSQQIVASGGVPPYTFTATGLPAGTALSVGGLLSGVPTAAGNSNVVVTVTDALLQSGTSTYPLNVVNTLAITTPSLPDGNLPDGLINSPYAKTLEAAGGTPPYIWGWQVGSTLPSGISLSTTGVLSGIPTDLGTSPEFIVQVQDSSATPLTATARFSLTNLAPDLIESDATGNEVAANLAVDNGSSTCVVDETQTFVMDAGTYGASPPNPPGTTLVNGLFKISVQGCTPGEAKLTIKLVYPFELEPGSQYWKYGKTADNPTDHWYPLPNAVIEGNTITFTITDGGLGDDDLQANGSITDPGGAADPWNLTPVAVPTGSPINLTLPTNLTNPIASCGVAAGYSLPAGLSIDCSSGALILSGTPTQAGIYTFAITVLDVQGGSSTEFYRMEIQQVTPIPTLSEWAMILLVICLVGLVGWRHQRQNALSA